MGCDLYIPLRLRACLPVYLPKAWQAGFRGKKIQ
jgi:hypothetical protein